MNLGRPHAARSDRAPANRRYPTDHLQLTSGSQDLEAHRRSRRAAPTPVVASPGSGAHVVRVGFWATIDGHCGYYGDVESPVTSVF